MIDLVVQSVLVVCEALHDLLEGNALEVKGLGGPIQLHSDRAEYLLVQIGEERVQVCFLVAFQ